MGSYFELGFYLAIIITYLDLGAEQISLEDSQKISDDYQDSHINELHTKMDNAETYLADLKNRIKEIENSS